ncbi:MAG: hypothetical protein LLF28_01675 [Nitrospiraceae bacterium]|nr:hypothetical protein [Nitrospiraceae bacterium]
MKKRILEKQFSETTGKLHLPCPYRESTGIYTHVVLRGGYCYRSERCSIVKCKYNRIQADINSLISIVW